jgi:large subunit ribosomal protein L14
MVTIGTFLICSDNSGARVCKCVKVLGSIRQPGIARLGNRLVASVQTARHDKKIKKHDVIRGVLVRRCARSVRSNGVIFSSSDNAVVIIDKKNNPVATRIFGSISQELRRLRFGKILSTCSSII